ncbi:low molecular weight protein arginine phosphatase [Rubellicoccus peritrichatus]|uniref:protein-tyrosine-phosphatase n=1 Tax=Rubellicoccus peritrichatus TaxID=3080537 RepID=A0AAQ3LCF5_9BACT|nr:low molecular weight protein arginine phosphatase [Puniceicoccus sp. CR14]WOO40993.1 low molecular weight protein arginine phosphatase [Puniceicoccus sp. CR14]
MVEKNLITIVCTANICRSPMAEVLMRHALQAEEEPLKSLEVASAGVSAYSGEPASVNSVRAVKSVGLDLSHHSSQSISRSMIERSFAIFGMTQSHRMTIEMQYGEKLPNLFLLRELMPEGSSIEIPDPFGQNLSAYEACRDSMVEAVPSILAWLRKNYPQTIKNS